MKNSYFQKYMNVHSRNVIVAIVDWVHGATMAIPDQNGRINSEENRFLQDWDWPNLDNWMWEQPGAPGWCSGITNGYAGMGFYGLPAANTWTVGRHLALLNNQINPGIGNGIRPNLKSICVGHSLGSHVCGFMGKEIKKIQGNCFKLNKIIGMDPAGPIFELDAQLSNTYQQAENVRLTTNDAHQVEAIHTNTGFLGFRRPLGHRDFYINGGSQHPYCTNKYAVGPARTVCLHGLAYNVLTFLNNQNPLCLPNWKCSRNRNHVANLAGYTEGNPLANDNLAQCQVGGFGENGDVMRSLGELVGDYDEFTDQNGNLDGYVYYVDARTNASSPDSRCRVGENVDVTGPNMT